MTVYVVIAIHNRKEETLKCLDCLDKDSGVERCVIVVDGGSTDGVCEAIERSFSETIIIKGSNDLWWTAATNAGIQWVLERASNSDYILTLNNDLTFKPGYLSSLVHSAQFVGPNAMIGSVVYRSDAPDQLSFCGIKKNWITSRNKYASLKDADENGLIPTDLLPGRGTLIPVAVFSKIGLFDEKNFPQYAADYDFSLRAARSRIKLVVASKACLFSDVQKTGVGGIYRRAKLGEVLKSFWSIASPNHLGKRWRFAVRHCPLHLLISYLILDTLLVATSELRRRAHRLFHER